MVYKFPNREDIFEYLVCKFVHQVEVAELQKVFFHLKFLDLPYCAKNEKTEWDKFETESEWVKFETEPEWRSFWEWAKI